MGQCCQIFAFYRSWGDGLVQSHLRLAIWMMNMQGDEGTSFRSEAKVTPFLSTAKGIANWQPLLGTESSKQVPSIYSILFSEKLQCPRKCCRNWEIWRPWLCNACNSKSIQGSVALIHSINIYWVPAIFPGGSDGKESACNAWDLSSSPVWGKSPGGGNGNPLQCSCLENPMDRGA